MITKNVEDLKTVELRTTLTCKNYVQVVREQAAVFTLNQQFFQIC